MNIKDKVVVVTGAASGIGRAMAERFRAEGARDLVLADLTEEPLRELADQLGATAIPCDVSDELSVRNLIETTQRDCGHIDLYCGNAGIFRMGGAEAPNTDWEKTMAVNVTSHVYAARAMLPDMIKRGSGYILITASAAGLLNQVGSISYGVSKHAALAVAEWLQISHGHQGIKVSALCPQAVESQMTAQLAPDGGVAGLDGVLSAEFVADCVVQGIEKEEFLILPHPEVKKYFQGKAMDYDRWLGAMQKLHKQFGMPDGV